MTPDIDTCSSNFWGREELKQKWQNLDFGTYEGRLASYRTWPESHPIKVLKNWNQFDKKSNFYVIISPKIWLKLGCFTLAKLTQSGVSNVTKA